VHLLLWRALQLAVREGRSELDLGGVDVAGARCEPRPGDAMFGLLEFKRSFGGRWIELAGAHERALHPARARAGAALTRLGGGARRLVGSRKPER
jgi:lipid II:glycine glycyltransferase (peptidoglycan interpeptide bridge formation enzyme)